ncbi:unnamed protein product [Prorocentrum cordatum]|uniref:Reverse transcriptase Ty1/copia-type domain-containing protein n=1 Tax=Prorocentrum cordatum TaxID=2364126 RepID=A0ABN9UUS8_9DINO|nr:unnamed protein product [Polarella glacialis]
MRGLLSRIHVIPAGPGVTPVELRESASVAERVQEWEAQRSSADDARGDPGTLIELACGEEEDLIELREEDGADEQDRMLLQELATWGPGPGDEDYSPTSSFATAGPTPGGPRRGQEALVVIEVDDLIVSCEPSYESELKKLLTSRFHFGKLQVGEAEYAGRRIRQQPDGRILVDQEKYILEQVRPMRLDKERVKCPEELLDAGELRDYRGLVAKILWAARQSRPDVSGSASMLSAECPQVKIASAPMANKVARHLRCTASSCLTIWPLDLSAVTMVTCSDAGGPGSAKRDGAQGGWLVMLGDSRIKDNRRSRVSLLSWRSQRLRRVVSSTLSAETLSLSGALAEGQWLWLVFRDALYGDVRGPEWWNSGTSCPFAVALVDECAIAEASEGVAVVDAKSLFDTLSKNCGGAKADRRNAIEMAIVRDSMTAEGTLVRWVPHCKMPADALTKVDPGRGNVALTDLMHKGMLALTDESGSLDERSLDLSLKSRTRNASRQALQRESQPTEAGEDAEEAEEERGGGGRPARTPRRSPSRSPGLPGPVPSDPGPEPMGGEGRGVVRGS